MEDHALFSAAFTLVRDPISDASFASTIGWADALSYSYALIEEHLCLFSAADGDLTMMLPPMALTRTADARLGVCLERCFALMDDENGEAFSERSRIEYVSEEMLERIRDCERDALSASPMPGDYVYPRRAMVELAGGPLKGKRKLRSKFIRENPGYVLSVITPADVADCVALLGVWRHAADDRHEGEANERQIGTDILRERDEQFTICLLESISTLALESMTVRVNGRLVGFTIGERLSATQAVIYVEKTDPEFDGTPQFLFSAFCEHRFSDVDEINVGDDWGIASLRYTKTSYRPSRMLSKMMLTRQAVPAIGAIEPTTMHSLECAGAPVTLECLGVAQLAPSERIQFRRADRVDVRAIVSIESSSFSSKHERFSARQVRGLIENPRASVMIAELEGRVVGYAISLIRAHKRWRSGRVYGVAVEREFNGKGIGRALVQRTLEQLAQLDIARVYLEVRADNERAIALYRSFGFVAISNLADYYGVGVAGVRMRRVTPTAQELS